MHRCVLYNQSDFCATPNTTLPKRTTTTFTHEVRFSGLLGGLLASRIGPTFRRALPRVIRSPTTLAAGSIERSGAVTDPMRGPTRLIESTAPEIVRLAQELTSRATSERGAAVAIHNFVRDEIRFGFAPAFYDMTAREVLHARVGYCITKATLFSALLRAAGFATRQRFVALDADVLHGFLRPGASVDHAWTEVLIGDHWVASDSYVVDRPLAQAALALAKIHRDGRQLGYGVHIDGQSEWTAEHDAFIQCCNSGRVPRLVRADHGYFADAEDFYARCGAALNRKSLFFGLAFGLSRSRINARIAVVRAG
jgi:hypothetical protein